MEGNIAGRSDILESVKGIVLTEHLSERTIEEYRLRALAAPELLRADDHLSGCQECRDRAWAAAQPEQVLQTFDATLQAEGLSAGEQHVPYELLEAFVDEKINAADREITASHLDFCQLCQEEAADLRLYRAALADTSPKQPAPKARVSVVPAFAEKLVAVRRLFILRPPLRFAAALAVLLISVAAVLLWRQTRTNQDVALTTRPPANDQALQPSPTAATAATPLGSEDAQTQIVMDLEDNGGRVTLDSQGTIKGLELLSPGAQAAVKNALTTGRLAKSDSLAGLKGRSGTLMGGSPKASATFSLISPVGIVVRANRPKLSWRPLPGASSYTVTVLDADLKLVATSPALSAMSWTPPRALERGRSYQWQVTARKHDQEIVSPAAPAPEARFRILEREKDDELRRLERAGARSHLARGVLFAQAGLLDEAERELRALVIANPKSMVARKLLLSVRETKRR